MHVRAHTHTHTHTYIHTHRGFILKNPFKIHKLFTNLCNTAWKSKTHVLNSSNHYVKGCNPYYSRWPCILSVKIDRKCVLCDFAQPFYFFKTTVRSWEVQFLTDKLSFFPSTLKTTNSQTSRDSTQFSQTFKALKSVSHFSQTFKDHANPDLGSLSTESGFYCFRN